MRVEAAARLEDLLREHRASLVRLWVDEALGIYPEDARKFLRRQKDRFANPVGNTLSEELGALFWLLADDAPEEEWAPHLDRIMQVRSVQEFRPSQAVAFVFRLEDLVREAGGDAPADEAACRELAARLDRLALAAFDSYAGFRERIHRVRIDEVKRRVSTLAKMHGIGFADLEPGVGLPPAREGPEAPEEPADKT